jgi:hypothetical protein
VRKPGAAGEQVRARQRAACAVESLAEHAWRRRPLLRRAIRTPVRVDAAGAPAPGSMEARALATLPPRRPPLSRTNKPEDQRSQQPAQPGAAAAHRLRQLQSQCPDPPPPPQLGRSVRRLPNQH